MNKKHIRLGLIVKYNKASVVGSYEAEVVSIGLRIGIRIYKYEGSIVSEKVIFVDPKRLSFY